MKEKIWANPNICISFFFTSSWSPLSLPCLYHHLTKDYLAKPLSPLIEERRGTFFASPGKNPYLTLDFCPDFLSTPVVTLPEAVRVSSEAQLCLMAVYPDEKSLSPIPPAHELPAVPSVGTRRQVLCLKCKWGCCTTGSDGRCTVTWEMSNSTDAQALPGDLE